MIKRVNERGVYLNVSFDYHYEDSAPVMLRENVIKLIIFTHGLKIVWGKWLTPEEVDKERR